MSLIIKLMGKSVGYRFLFRKLQAMWRIQNSFTLINLSNDYYIVRFSNKQDYDMAFLNGPWVINDHYLQVRRWVPNFMARTVTIDSLLVWVRFPILPIEYYIERWLERAWNKIGRTIKVDRKMLMASREKFAWACVEIDLTKPLKAGYRMRNKRWPVQYEGFHDLCFQCGQYGHRASCCPTKKTSSPSENEAEAPSANQPSSKTQQKEDPLNQPTDEPEAIYGEWMVATRNRRRPARLPEHGSKTKAVPQETTGPKKSTNGATIERKKFNPE